MVDGHRGDDDQADQDVLVVIGDADQHTAVLDHGDDTGSGPGAEDASASPVEASSSDDDSGNDFQFQAQARDRIALSSKHGELVAAGAADENAEEGDGAGSGRYARLSRVVLRGPAGPSTRFTSPDGTSPGGKRKEKERKRERREREKDEREKPLL